MTEEEAVQIAEYVAAACPAQKFSEYTPDVWAEILAPYAVDEARDAVIAVARRQPWISPAEIVTEIKERREERIELAHVVYDGNPLETGAQSVASRRALIQAAADGRAQPRAITAALGTGTVPALSTSRRDAAIAQIGRMPGKPPPKGVVNVRAVACRHCNALPGVSCNTSRGRRMTDVHPGRLEDARRAAAGLPPVDPAEEQREIDRRIAASAARAAAETDHPEPEETT
ncbi:zinc finger domain-containing protein [Streptomyces chryseus]